MSEDIKLSGNEENYDNRKYQAVLQNAFVQQKKIFYYVRSHNANRNDNGFQGNVCVLFFQLQPASDKETVRGKYGRNVQDRAGISGNGLCLL